MSSAHSGMPSPHGRSIGRRRALAGTAAGTVTLACGRRRWPPLVDAALQERDGGCPQAPAPDPHSIALAAASRSSASSSASSRASTRSPAGIGLCGRQARAKGRAEEGKGALDLVCSESRPQDERGPGG